MIPSDNYVYYMVFTTHTQSVNHNLHDKNYKNFSNKNN